MAAPNASYIISPPDGDDKQLRSQTQVISGTTVHEEFAIPSPGFTHLASYHFATNNLPFSVAATDGITNGLFWIINPGNSAVVAVIRRVIIDMHAWIVGTSAQGPVLNLNKFYFSGAIDPANDIFNVSPSPAVPAQTAQPITNLKCAVSNNGITVALLGDIGQYEVPATATAVGMYYGSKEIISYNPFAFQRGLSIELAPSEGIVFYQTVGSSAIGNLWSLQFEWDEIEDTGPATIHEIIRATDLVTTDFPNYPSYVNSGVFAAAASATNLTLTLPQVLAIGNVLLAVTILSSASNPSWPTGWTPIGAGFAAYRVVDGTEVSGPNVSWTGSNNITGIISQWTGVTGVGATSDNQASSGTPATTSAITTTADHSLCVAAIISGTNTVLPSVPSGYIDQGTTTNSITVVSSIRLAVTPVAFSGTSSSAVSSTVSSINAWRALLVELKSN